MSPESLIMLAILVIAILGIAWAIDYAAAQAGAPRPVKIVIWVIAALLLLLVLLRQTRILDMT
jgi:hypothetical protein